MNASDTLTAEESPSLATTEDLSFEDWAIKVAEAKKEYYAADKDSDDEKAALARWYNFAFHQIDAALFVSQASTAHEDAPRNTPIEEAAAMKWDELTIADAEAANTVPKAEMTVKTARPGSAAEEVAKKTLKLLMSFLEEKKGELFEGEICMVSQPFQRLLG